MSRDFSRAAIVSVALAKLTSSGLYKAVQRRVPASLWHLREPELLIGGYGRPVSAVAFTVGPC